VIEGGDADGDGSRVRVLVVDDEPDVRTLLRYQLDAAGFEVVGEASDGNEALEQCAALAPDAVVMDLLMPRASGFDAIPRIKRMHPGVGIVAYTAVAGDFVRREMERLHIPVVLKSGRVDPLADALRAVVQT
jgi:two-component system nitrate/nitrite response regulator NarL